MAVAIVTILYTELSENAGPICRIIVHTGMTKCQCQDNKGQVWPCGYDSVTVTSEIMTLFLGLSGAALMSATQP